MKCFVCGNLELYTFLTLGHQPPSDAFLRPEDLHRPEITYPLNLCLCEKCYLVQLDYVVDPKELFVDYVYNTGSNNGLKIHFHELVESLVRRFKLQQGDLAIDIGSNDGTLLSNYRPYGITILGIDPSSSTSLAIEQGVPTIVDFFNYETALRAKERHGRASIITATNVFAHVDDLDGFMRGVEALLDDNGVFVSESGYVLDFVLQRQYDSTYHEHLRYYSLKPLQVLFSRYGMEIFDVERIPIHGGSIRVFAARVGAHPKNTRVDELVQLEKDTGLYNKDFYTTFARWVAENRFILRSTLMHLKAKGNRIVGIGAPAKGNTLLNTCQIGPDLIDYLVERSPLKIGRYSPGMHIPVVDEARLFEEQPEYGLLLSWNIADELIKKLRNKGYKGKFIIPCPIPSIIE